MNIILIFLFIYYLLLTTKTQTCKMNLPNLLLPNLPNHFFFA